MDSFLLDLSLSFLDLLALITFLALRLLLNRDFIRAPGNGPLLVTDFFQSIEPAVSAADGASIIVTDANLLGGLFDRDLFIVDRLEKLSSLLVSDLPVLSHH